MGAGARRTFVLTTIAAALNVAAQAQAQNFRNYECQGGAHFEALVVPGANSIYVQLDGSCLALRPSPAIGSVGAT
jgi:hypothetical protein